MNNSIFSFFPNIDLGDVILRKISVEQDYIDYFYYITSPHVTAYLSQDDIPDTMERAKSELNYWGRLFDFQSSIYWRRLKQFRILHLRK
jgi:hypothetical protein